MLRIPFIIAISFLALSLQGCLAAFAVGAAAGGAVIYNSKDIQQTGTDQTISYNANNALTASAKLQGLCSDQCNISTATLNQHILLVGEVPSQEALDAATELAQSVKGVATVYNKLTISKPIGSGVKTSDSWITTKVKSALVSTSGISSGQLKIVTENSVVYLMGILPTDQINKVINITRNIDGVKKVVTFLEPLPTTKKSDSTSSPAVKT